MTYQDLSDLVYKAQKFASQNADKNGAIAQAAVLACANQSKDPEILGSMLSAALDAYDEQERKEEADRRKAIMETEYFDDEPMPEVRPYNPAPLDINSIVIPENLEPLVETIAEFVHDQWAAQRIADGWTYGPTRDDAKKTHPCLIPYADLPESEKQYDRITAMTVIYTILSKGWQIVK